MKNPSDLDGLALPSSPAADQDPSADDQTTTAAAQDTAATDRKSAAADQAPTAADQNSATADQDSKNTDQAAADQAGDSGVIIHKLLSETTAAAYRFPPRYRHHDVRQHSILNTRNNERWEQECTARGSEDLHASFWLLSDFMPKYLSAIAMVTRLVEPALFEGVELERHTLGKCMYGTEEIPDPNESLLSHCIRLSECSHDKIVEKLARMNESPSAFFDNLTNLSNGGLLIMLEHLMHEQVVPDIIRPDYSDRMTKQHFFVRMLLMIGARGALVRKATGLSRGTFNLMYRDFLLEYPQMRVEESAEENRDLSEFVALLQDPNKCRFASLIVSLYILCMRMNLNLKATFRPLVLKGIPRDLSYSTAAGCYSCVRNIYLSYDHREWNEQSFKDNFPSFNAIVELLKSLLNGDTRIVGCSKCHTPYFVVVSQRLKRKLGCGLKVVCPKCSADAEYDPNAE